VELVQAHGKCLYQAVSVHNSHSPKQRCASQPPQASLSSRRSHCGEKNSSHSTELDNRNQRYQTQYFTMASDFTYPVLFDRAKQIRVNAGIPGPIPVNHLHLLNPSVWRLAGFYSHIYSFYFYYAFWFVWLISWYELRLGALIVARWFPKSRFRDVVRDIPPGREIIMVSVVGDI